MEEIIPDDEEMDEETLLALVADPSIFRPRMPAMRSCSCEKRLDELILLVRSLREELVRED